MLTFQTSSTLDRNREPLPQRQPRYRTRNSKSQAAPHTAPSTKGYRDTPPTDATDSDSASEPEESHDSQQATTSGTGTSSAHRDDSSSPSPSPPPNTIHRQSPRTRPPRFASPESAPSSPRVRAKIHRAAQGLFQNAKTEMGNRIKLHAQMTTLQREMELDRIPRDIRGFEPLSRVYATHRGSDGSINFSPRYHALLKKQAAQRATTLMDDLREAHAESLTRENRFRSLMAAVYDSENDDGLPEALAGLERAGDMYRAGEAKRDNHGQDRERALGTLTETKVTSLLVQPTNKLPLLKSPLKAAHLPKKKPRSLLKTPAKVTRRPAAPPSADHAVPTHPGNPPATYNNHRQHRKDDDRRRDAQPSGEHRGAHSQESRKMPQSHRQGHRGSTYHPYQSSQPRDRPTLPPRQRDRYTPSQRERRPKSPSRSQLLDRAISAISALKKL